MGTELSRLRGRMEMTEQAIFDELGQLCASPGYIQALAFICFNDNFIGIGDELSGQDLLEMHSPDRLIRTELMTLVGLMVKRPIDYALPEPETIQKYIEETHRLLKALHRVISSPFFDQITPEKVKDPTFNPFAYGSALREPIFFLEKQPMPSSFAISPCPNTQRTTRGSSSIRVFLSTRRTALSRASQKYRIEI